MSFSEHPLGNFKTLLNINMIENNPRLFKTYWLIFYFGWWDIKENCLYSTDEDKQLVKTCLSHSKLIHGKQLAYKRVLECTRNVDITSNTKHNEFKCFVIWYAHHIDINALEET